MPSVVLIGSRATIACVGLRLLRENGVSVPLVISGDEDPGADDWRFSLAKLARELGYRDNESLYVVHDPHQAGVLDRIRIARPDFILSLQWRRILRQPLLSIPTRCVVNLHNAPVPLLRGCDPFSWAIHDGLQLMGVTLHQVVDEGVDSGPILAQRRWPITPSTTAWDLYQQSLVEAEILMRESLDNLLCGRLSPQIQDPRYASYHPMGQFSFHDLEADWRLPAVTLSASLRSRIFPPFQLPWFDLGGHRVEILSCRAATARGKPATITSIAPLTISARSGAIQIEQIKVNGVEMTGADFARQKNIKVGDCVMRPG